jgi:hypothetical protein
MLHGSAGVPERPSDCIRSSLATGRCRSSRAPSPLQAKRWNHVHAKLPADQAELQRIVYIPGAFHGGIESATVFTAPDRLFDGWEIGTGRIRPAWMTQIKFLAAAMA